MSQVVLYSVISSCIPLMSQVETGAKYKSRSHCDAFCKPCVLFCFFFRCMLANSSERQRLQTASKVARHELLWWRDAPCTLSLYIHHDSSRTARWVQSSEALHGWWPHHICKFVQTSIVFLVFSLLCQRNAHRVERPKPTRQRSRRSTLKRTSTLVVCGLLSVSWFAWSLRCVAQY